MKREYKAFDVENNEINVGDEILDFRGDRHRFLGITQEGKKVYTETTSGKNTGWKQEYFPSVFKITIVICESGSLGE